MRCILCDYNPEAPSLYNEGLATSCGGKLSWSEFYDGYVCEGCVNSSEDFVVEDENDEKFILDNEEEG